MDVCVSYKAETLPEGIGIQDADEIIESVSEEFGGEHVGGGMMMISPCWRDQQIDIPEKDVDAFLKLAKERLDEAGIEHDIE